MRIIFNCKIDNLRTSLRLRETSRPALKIGRDRTDKISGSGYDLSWIPPWPNVQSLGNWKEGPEVMWLYEQPNYRMLNNTENLTKMTAFYSYSTSVPSRSRPTLHDYLLLVYIAYFLCTVHMHLIHFNFQKKIVVTSLPLLPILAIISALPLIPLQSILGRSNFLKGGKSDVSIYMASLRHLCQN